MVRTRSGPHLRQFVFPKAVLAVQGVVASGDATTSRQAQRTQAWQLRYFVDMSQGHSVDLERVKALLALRD